MLGDGPTVLMLHGIGGGHLAFAPQVETLASSGFRAVAWDMPGYGRSAPIEPYNFKGLANSCVALVEGLDCGAVTLVGHGMGGMLAQEVIARRPELVSRLVLCGAPSCHAEWAEDDSALALLDAGKAMPELAQWLVPQRIGPGSLPEGVRLATHCLGLVSPVTFRHAVQALPAFDRRAGLANIHVPTLLLAGEYDRQVPPAVMKDIARSIAGSTFIELAGVGHFQNLEAPDEFDAALLNFLALPRHLH